MKKIIILLVLAFTFGGCKKWLEERSEQKFIEEYGLEDYEEIKIIKSYASKGLLLEGTLDELSCFKSNTLDGDSIHLITTDSLYKERCAACQDDAYFFSDCDSTQLPMIDFSTYTLLRYFSGFDSSCEPHGVERRVFQNDNTKSIKFFVIADICKPNRDGYTWYSSENTLLIHKVELNYTVELIKIEE